MRILGCERDTKACNYYRIQAPLDHIKIQQLADCSVIPYDSGFREDNMTKVFETDIVLIPRPSSEEWFGFVKACRKAAKIVVSDYDDDPFTCDPMNPYYRWIGVEEWKHPDFGWVWKHGEKDPRTGQEWFNIEKNINRRDMLRAAFGRSDLVTCTTEELKEVFVKINPNTVVLPNSIDLDCYPEANLVKKNVRIGWQGGVSHYRDLQFILPVLERLHKKHPDVEFVYFGDTIRFESFLNHYPFLERHCFVNHETYPYKLKLLNLDIGLCPLIDNVFNRRKSAIKWMEYSAVGAATVASDIPPYSKAITNFKDGVLVPNDEKLWEEALLGLISDRKKILELSNAAIQTVIEGHTIQKNAHLWTDAYKRVIEKEMSRA